MTLDQFVTQNSGKTLSYDHVPENAGQCVQAVEFYFTQVVEGQDKPFWGDAIKWWDNFDGSVLTQYFDKVPKVPGKIPSRGDIVIWDGSLPNSGGAGHIAVCLSANYTNFASFDSNWAGKYAHQVAHDYTHVKGWLHLKQGGNDMIVISNRAEGHLAYKLIQHRDCSDQDADGIIGKTLSQLWSLWVDNPQNNKEWLTDNHYIMSWGTLQQHAADLETQIAATPNNSAAAQTLQQIKDILNKQVQ